MSREILFQGKLLDNSKWVIGGYAKLSPDNEFYPGTTCIFEMKKDGHQSNLTAVFPETIGQYTTLNDERGQMVFEGDILIDSYRRKLLVVWHLYRLKFEWIEQPLTAHFKYADLFDWVDEESGQLTAQKIGNIHDK